ncbi:hypothetical protein ACFSYH_02015 [Populibacterium corticicola]|uniref:Uncharacterized protein n=1 Tax=Populibacterium corticicola TaxID=1812826 RepID=A0ABW5XB98_9MICO
MKILAIDPGNTHSGWVIIDAKTHQPLQFGKSPNHEVLNHCYGDLNWDLAVIEMIASYGMAVGREVFDTCVWIGRYLQAIHDTTKGLPTLTYRREVKLHHCHTSKAKDANITQALIDRYAYGQPNRGKGTKASPGWFHGFHADIWQAYALATHHADTLNAQFTADTLADVQPVVHAQETRTA